MALNNYFAKYSLTAWSFDDVNDLRNIQGDTDYDKTIDGYINNHWGDISKLFFSMGMKFNLGGNEEKSRLETTSRPIGVFDFGLASKGLYKVQEYFSQKKFLALGGGFPSTLRFSTMILQCPMGSLWKMPYSMPGPLPQKSGALYHHHISYVYFNICIPIIVIV